MKINFMLIMLLLVFSSTFGQPVSIKRDNTNLNSQQGVTSQDSIKLFYKELFSALKIGYLHKKTVNWQDVEAET